MPGYVPDPRDLKSGNVVSDLNGYYDSQNIICVYDKNIQKEIVSCVLHHSSNREGGKGLCLSHCRSEDGGRTWSELIPIEDPKRQSHDGYQCLIGERIYVFYGWNEGSHPPRGPQYPRTNMQLDEGFWFKWSDDYGISFSQERVLIPVRRTLVDRLNPWKGKTIGAFCCDKPVIIDNMLYFAFQKTRDGNGESYGSEVFFMRSKDFIQRHWESVRVTTGMRNTASASRVSPACVLHSVAKTIKATKEALSQSTWETLPDSDRGLQSPRGLLLGEEPHILQLEGRFLMSLWRNELGFLDSAYSYDYGKTWRVRWDGDPGSEYIPMKYGGANFFNLECTVRFEPFKSKLNESLKLKDDVIEGISDGNEKNTSTSLAIGQIQKGDPDNDFVENNTDFLKSAEFRQKITNDTSIIRNPRGAITPFRMRDGLFCLIFYNNGHTERLGYCGRLVYWLTIGKVVRHTDGYPAIFWSQPDIALYWDGVCLENRDEWNEDWAIVDGPGYADFQETTSEDLVLVESNKLTVRFHKIDRYQLKFMKQTLEMQFGVASSSSGSLNGSNGNGSAGVVNGSSSKGSAGKLPIPSWPRSALAALIANHRVVSWRYEGDRKSVQLRAPVLADLRTGQGFSFCLRLLLPATENPTSPSKRRKVENSKVKPDTLNPEHPFDGKKDGILLVDGMSRVSAALDEPRDDTVWKGYYISLKTIREALFSEDQPVLRLFVSDGFEQHLSYDVRLALHSEAPRNPLRNGSAFDDVFNVSFTLDGGAKVVTAVVNGELYNESPQGWKFFPRVFGEIGGCNVRIPADVFLKSFEVYDKSLLVAERVALFHTSGNLCVD